VRQATPVGKRLTSKIGWVSVPGFSWSGLHPARRWQREGAGHQDYRLKIAAPDARTTHGSLPVGAPEESE
jgi:hypothetical protein